VAKNPLAEAETLFRRKRHPAVIGLLEPLAAAYRDSSRYYYLLGLSYLFMDDSGGAYSCLRRAAQIDFRDPGIAYAMAAIHVRRGETDKAIQCYLEILERDPANRRARRALSFLRSIAASGKNSESIPRNTARKLYPVASRPEIFLVPIALAAVVACVVLVFPAARGLLESRKPSRPGVSGITLDSRDNERPVTTGGTFSVVLTANEALETFEKAKRLFIEYRDEAALVELNRLSSSNASVSIKAKADALRAYVRVPGFSDIKDSFTYTEVMAAPNLYDGVCVVWRGLAANVLERSGGTGFDLLVGYEGMKRLLGIVSVIVAFPSEVVPDKPLEVLGRLRTSTVPIVLECLAIHELRD